MAVIISRPPSPAQLQTSSMLMETHRNMPPVIQGLPLWRSPLVLALTLLAATSFSPRSHAQSEMDKPLFVTNGGVDEGRCLDPAAPCASIGCALGRVGKGGQVRVASSRYELTEVGDIFALVSGLVDARGGYREVDRFAAATSAPTILIGVPQEYRERLSGRGFHVIADRKQLGRSAATEKLLAMNRCLKKAMAAASCDGGTAGGLTCWNTELYAPVASADVSAWPAAAVDVWGLVHLNSNREYALVSFNNGTAVFDGTDTGNSREVGFFPGQDTTWRDIKVHQFFNAGEQR